MIVEVAWSKGPKGKKLVKSSSESHLKLVAEVSNRAGLPAMKEKKMQQRQERMGGA